MNARRVLFFTKIMILMYLSPVYGGEMFFLGDTERQYHEAQRKQVVALMDLKTMFPDPKVRALAKAAGKGRIKTVDKLIAEGVDVNAKGLQNATPLFWALRRSNLKGFTHLLELGADPNVLFGDGSTTVHWSAANENPKFLEQALRFNGDPNLVNDIREGRETPIFYAISSQNSSKEKVELLIKAGANFNVQGDFGDTPMMSAASLLNFETVHMMLELGANTRIKNDNGKNLWNRIESKEKLINPNAKEVLFWLDKVKEKLKDF